MVECSDHHNDIPYNINKFTVGESTFTCYISSQGHGDTDFQWDFFKLFGKSNLHCLKTDFTTNDSTK